MWQRRKGMCGVEKDEEGSRKEEWDVEEEKWQRRGGDGLCWYNSGTGGRIAG